MTIPDAKTALERSTLHADLSKLGAIQAARGGMEREIERAIVYGVQTAELYLYDHKWRRWWEEVVDVLTDDLKCLGYSVSVKHYATAGRYLRVTWGQ